MPSVPASRQRIQVQLTYTCIQNHHSLVWLDSFPYLYHLLEQFRLLLVTSGRIDDNDVETLLLEFSHTLGSDGDGICLCVGTEVRDLRFGRGLSGLVEGTGTEGIRTDDT